MKKYMKYLTLAFISSFALAVSACDTPATETTEEVDEVVYTDTYLYADQSYEIKSVVRYQTATTIEMWFSSVADLKTIEQIVEKGNYGVVAINRTYLGGRDLFKKSGSYIAFNGMRFDNRHSAKAFIDMSIDGSDIKFKFKAETLYENGTSTGKGFEGNYDGTFVEHEQNLDNQWSHNRVIKNILKAKVFIDMDNEYNTTTKFAFYDDEAYMHEAVTVTIPQDCVGEEIVEKSDVISITYDNGKEFELANSANINKLLASLIDDNAEFDMDLINGTELLAANYEGKVVIDENKPNHISCKIYEKSGNEWTELKIRIYPVSGMFVRAGSSTTTFYFPMVDNPTTEDLNYYPKLSVETKYVNGNYLFENEAVGRFSFSDDFNTISDQPFGDNASPKATMCLTRIDDFTYKIVLRIRDLEITLSKKADIEVFYEGIFM